MLVKSFKKCFPFDFYMKGKPIQFGKLKLCKT